MVATASVIQRVRIACFKFNSRMKRWQAAGWVIVALILLASSAWWIARRLSESERTAWKDTALPRLASLSLTNQEIRTELEEMSRRVRMEEGSIWAGERVLRMSNGEFIVYEYRHGRNDFFPPHLFLGRCSDGRWLYSSYHFCNSMNMVTFDPMPNSIADFSKKYSAREFDGKSDVCLKLTQ